MRLKKLVFGLIGGIAGFALSVPLVMHESWCRIIMMRRQDELPLNRLAFILFSGIIFPILILLGLVATPVVTLLATYQCGKSASIEPIVETFAQPYEELKHLEPLEAYMSRGTLIGYSLIMGITSFVFLNIITGGAVNMLALPGSAILAFFGANTHSFYSSFMIASSLAYVGSLLGAATVSAYEFFARPEHLHTPVIGTHSNYHLIIEKVMNQENQSSKKNSMEMVFNYFAKNSDEDNIELENIPSDTSNSGYKLLPE